MLTLRRTTVIALCAAAAFTLVQGARVTSFAIAEIRRDPSHDRSAQLEGWRDSLGLAVAARDPGRFVLKMQDPAQFSRREQALADYLAVRPMAAAAWLELAELRYTLGQPTARTLEAFTMAELTGPYEGDVMAGRAMLGALLWDSLGEDDKRHTARDLALAPFEPPDVLRIQALLRAKPRAVRSDIRDRVLAIDSRSEDRLGILGFDADEGRGR